MLYHKCPVKKAKGADLLRNLAFALGNIGEPAAVPALVRALNGEPPLVRGHAAWALGRLVGGEAMAALRARADVEEDSWVAEEIALALSEAASRNDDTNHEDMGG